MAAWDFIKSHLITLVVAIAMALAPIREITGYLLLLMAIDLVTGVIKAVKAGEFVLSRGFRDTVAKSPYLLALLAAFSLDRIMGSVDPTFARIVAVFLGGIELKSVGENLKAVTGIDILASVIDRLKPKDEAK